MLLVTLGGITSLCSIAKALITKKLVDSAVTNQIRDMVIFLAVFGSLIIIDILVQAVSSKISTYIYTKMYNSIQGNLYKNIIHANWQELSKYHSGDILTRITNDSDVITNLSVNIFPSVVSSMLLMLASFILLFRFDPLLPLLAFAFSPLPMLIGRFYSSKLKRLHKLSQQLESKYRSILQESLSNSIIIKTFCLEEKSINRLEKLQEEKLSVTMKRNTLNTLNNSFFKVSSWTTFFLVYAWGAFSLSNGTATFGTVSALAQLISNFQGPFMSIASSLVSIVTSTASIERLIELEGICTEQKRYKLPHLSSAAIQFNNVSFQYNKNKLILKDISTMINPSETIALIGASGEGKTTLIRLLLSLVYPVEGSISAIDNFGQYSVDANLRNFISYVPQGNTLFSGTIRENLLNGNEKASTEEIKNAASAACAWDFIEGLEKGLDTEIGEHGLGLSEGQAQRLSIARALLRKAPLLILDEATSALDMDTELKVLLSIQNLNPKPTSIIITHRPSALSICDRILKLENGSLYEMPVKTGTEVALEVS